MWTGSTVSSPVSTEKDVSEPMELTLNRNLLKYAVQRAIFNRDGGVADIRRSALITIEGHGAEVVSGEMLDQMAPRLTELASRGYVVEVLDGRALNSRSAAKQAKGAYTVQPVPPAADPNQEALF